MKPSDLDISKYVTPPEAFDRKDHFHYVTLEEDWGPGGDEPYHVSVIPDQVVVTAAPNDNVEVLFIKVSAAKFRRAFGSYFKMKPEKGCTYRFFYEHGTNGFGVYSYIQLHVEAYVKERKMVYLVPDDGQDAYL